jgi:hypothetical protein
MLWSVKCYLESLQQSTVDSGFITVLRVFRFCHCTVAFKLMRTHNTTLLRTGISHPHYLSARIYNVSLLSNLRNDTINSIKTTLTHSLMAEPFLRSHQFCSYSRTSQHYMEPEVSLPCSQQPSTGPYSKPDQSNPSHPISLKIRTTLQTLTLADTQEIPNL